MEQRKRILEANPDADPDADVDPITATIKAYFNVFDEPVEDDDDEDEPQAEQKYDHADLDALYAQLPSQPAGAMDDDIVCKLIERHPMMTSLDRQTCFVALAKIPSRKSLSGISIVNESVKNLVKTFSSSFDVIEHILFSSLNSLFHCNEKYAQSEGAVFEDSPLLSFSPY